MRTLGVLVSALAGVSLVLAGCTQWPERPAELPPEPGALASFDMCTVLTAGERVELGLPQRGEPVNSIGSVGCKFIGDRWLVTPTRDHTRPFSFYEQRAPSYDRWVPNRVHDRRGAQIVTSRSGRECSQIAEAGRGTVNISVIYRFDYIGAGDPCADALRIAELIEPRLPEVGT